MLVVAAGHFKHNGKDYKPRDMVDMDDQTAADMLALRQVRVPHDEEVAAHNKGDVGTYNRRDMTAEKRGGKGRR